MKAQTKIQKVKNIQPGPTQDEVGLTCGLLIKHTLGSHWGQEWH